MSTTEISELTEEQFVTLMGMVRNHARASFDLIAEGYSAPLPSTNWHAGVGTAQGLPQAAIDALRRAEHSTTGIIDRDKQNLDTITRQRVDSINGSVSTAGMSQEEFERKLAEQRDKNKKEFDGLQDRVYNELVQVGRENPNSRNAILDAFTGLSELLSGLFGQLANFVVELVKNVVKWLKEAFEKIGQWAEGAWNSTKDFFRRLFG